MHRPSVIKAAIGILLVGGVVAVYVMSSGRHEEPREITAKFLKTPGGKDSLLQQQLLMAPVNTKLTVVTAYFNIGSFQKGDGNKVFKPSLYRQWMRIFSRIANPVVAFFDDEEDMKMFAVLRNALPARDTKIVRVVRSETWAFSLRPKIDAIFRSLFYPKHHPNTVVPDYSCAMHAKYELMSRVARENPFGSQFFSWLDVGLFRSEAGKADRPPFSLTLPPDFDRTKVAYTEVSAMERTDYSPAEIVRGNLVWLCGCYFVAERRVMIAWTAQYMAFTERLLGTGWMSTDQQVLLFMFQRQFDGSPDRKVSVQTYKGDGRFNGWFHLGYLSVSQHSSNHSAPTIQTKKNVQ